MSAKERLATPATCSLHPFSLLMHDLIEVTDDGRSHRRFLRHDWVKEGVILSILLLVSPACLRLTLLLLH